MPAMQQPSGPTLTNVTYMGRMTVKYGFLVLVVLIVGRITLNAFVAYWKATHPPPPPPPTVGFGVLPQISFSDEYASEAPVSFSLETANGRLPTFPDRAKVFFMPHPSSSLLDDQRAKTIASEYDFVFDPEILNSEEYRWTKSQPLQMTLELNIRNKHLTLKTDYLSRPELLLNSNPPQSFAAVENVKSWLKQTDLLPSDVATASGEVTFMKALGGELEPALSESDADYIRVDLFRTPIDNRYRMYSPTGLNGSISAVVSGAFNGKNSVVDLYSYYTPVDYTQVHTYPLRDVQDAWQVLRSGEGYIAHPSDSETAVIRQVTLGYYDDFAEQKYLQPIYVFSNDEDGFLGYVSAIDPKYVQSSQK